MNQFDERHYKFQRYPDRTSWSYRPNSEPWWFAWIGGAAIGVVLAVVFFLGV